MLHKFDYLSTVSGGGYIGSWLAALTRVRLKLLKIHHVDISITTRDG
jgi:hypothetical protein